MGVQTRKTTRMNDTAKTNETVDTENAESSREQQPAKNATGKGQGKKSPAKGKTKSPPAKVKAKHQDEDPQENDNDSGRNSSRTFFTQASRSKKRKVTAANSKEDIQETLDKFLEILEKEPEKEPSNMADKLRDHLPSDLKEIMVYHTEHQSPSGDLPKCKPVDTAFAALHQISTTLKKYHHLSTSTPIKRPDWMEWEQDRKSLVDLNEHALRIAARQVNSMVIPGKKLDEKPERAGDVEKLAWEIFEDHRPEDLEKTWGGMARQQVRTFMGVLQGVTGA